jgi:hypothetical protein
VLASAVSAGVVELDDEQATHAPLITTSASEGTRNVRRIRILRLTQTP